MTLPFLLIFQSVLLPLVLPEHPVGNTHIYFHTHYYRFDHHCISLTLFEQKGGE